MALGSCSSTRVELGPHPSCRLPFLDRCIHLFSGIMVLYDTLIVFSSVFLLQRSVSAGNSAHLILILLGLTASSSQRKEPLPASWAKTQTAESDHLKVRIRFCSKSPLRSFQQFKSSSVSIRNNSALPIREFTSPSPWST